VKRLLLRIIPAIIYLLVVLFLALVACMVALSLEFPRQLFIVLAALGVAFCLLGGALVVLTMLGKVKGKRKLFFILTGGSAAGVLVFVFLHNFVYGLCIWLFGRDFWTNIGMTDEPVFFILGLLVCPILFLVGAIGSIVMLVKDRKTDDAVSRSS